MEMSRTPSSVGMREASREDAITAARGGSIPASRQRRFGNDDVPRTGEGSATRSASAACGQRAQETCDQWERLAKLLRKPRWSQNQRSRG